MSIGEEVELQGLAKEANPMHSPKSGKAGKILEKQTYFYLQGIAEVTLDIGNKSNRIMV